MDVSYEFKVEAPDQRLVLSIGEYDDHGKLLDAVFSGKERAISDGVLLKMFITHPLDDPQGGCRNPLGSAKTLAEKNSAGT